MNCHCIPYSEIPGATNLFTDYIYNFPKVSEFYAYAPFDADSLAAAGRSIQYPDEMRREVVAILREQNQRLSASSKAFENLTKLADPVCVAVVTGNQPGIFSGPAFTIYKALSAVKTADHLSRQGIPAVPVFWVATEDHDLAEVNHCFVQDREGNPQRLAFEGQAPVANSPVGAVSFDDSLPEVLNALGEMLPDSAAGREVFEVVKQCYQPGQHFGNAFAQLISSIFSSYGLIVLDPMDRRLHELSAPVFQKAIKSASSIVEELTQVNQKLAQAGYHAQVHVGESFTLLFVIINGERRALRLRDGRFVTAQGDSFSAEDLLQQFERNPETISPNVLLRPVMQDALLPTVAYVGGPSEVAYMAQASVVYRRILGRMPVILPRASLTVLDAASQKLLPKYDLTVPDILAGKQALREKMAARLLPPDLTELFRKAASHLEADLKDIQLSLERLDKTLVDAAVHGGSKMQYQLSTLEKKAAAAIQNRSDQIERDAVRLENNVYPAKAPQERLYSGISILARYGSGFLNDLYEQIPLHASQHQVIHL